MVRFFVHTKKTEDKTTMKKQFLALSLLICLVFTACANDVTGGVWENATVTENASYGMGATTIEVEVKAEDKAVTLTIKTDKATLGDALKEHSLIDGDKGEFGIYVKKVIGITADYDVDQSYWSFTKNGEMLMTGVDGVEISNGEHYEITYTK